MNQLNLYLKITYEQKQPLCPYFLVSTVYTIFVSRIYAIRNINKYSESLLLGLNQNSQVSHISHLSLKPYNHLGNMPPPLQLCYLFFGIYIFHVRSSFGQNNRCIFGENIKNQISDILSIKNQISDILSIGQIQESLPHNFG